MVTDITAFPTTQKAILIAGDNVQTFKVGATAVKAGHVVSISATGLDFTVIPCIAEAGSCPVGVAIQNAAVGAQVAVAMIGCIARVSGYASDVDLDAGDYVTWNDAAPGGTVIACSGSATQPLVGRMLEDLTGSALTLKAMLVLCGATNVIHA